MSITIQLTSLAAKIEARYALMPTDVQAQRDAAIAAAIMACDSALMVATDYKPPKTLKLIACDKARNPVTNPTTDTEFGIIALPDEGTVPSIAFGAFGPQPAHVESNAPYSLLGDVSGLINVRKWPAGTVSGSASVMSAAGGAGSVLYSGSLVVVVSQAVAVPATGRPSKASTQPLNAPVHGKLNLNGNTVVQTIFGQKYDAAGANYALQADSNNALVTFSHCEFTGAQSALFYGRNLKFVNCYFHKSGGDGGKPCGNVTMEGCYITDLGRNVGAHADGLQIRGDTGGGDNITIKGCFFDQAHDNLRNCCVFVQVPSCENVTIDGNWFAGSNGPGAVDIWDSAKPSTIKVTNNTFDTSTFRNDSTGKTPPINVQKDVVVSGNVDQTGKAIS